MNLGFGGLKKLFGGGTTQAPGATPIPQFAGTSYGGADAFGGTADDNGAVGGLPNYSGEFDSMPSDYGNYSSMPLPTGAPDKPGMNKKKLKKGLQGFAATSGAEGISQGMPMVKPFELTRRGLL